MKPQSSLVGCCSREAVETILVNNNSLVVNFYWLLQCVAVLQAVEPSKQKRDGHYISYMGSVQQA
jgi:hypothetical protein